MKITVNGVDIETERYVEEGYPLRNDEWISVDERLPELLQKVLFFAVQDELLNNIYMGYLCEEGWDIYLPYSSFKLSPEVTHITHWMELPELP